ncbi:MAG: excinuclease ABC subunit UvrA [Oscillospiraceae bacterium]|jgi:excinuclease ABC subunit A|nr:excinuclease ABC subunit UvrA [Oscillospiraceae bacterium]
MRNEIVIKGARTNNLKDISLTIPRDKLVVFTGLSGSGKSSLAFATLYAEGQRRYIESLSSYARQFLGQMEKPDVDSIEGLSPAIAIDQKTTSHNPRSTVGTVTEIYDYLRLLWARVGIPHCHICGREIRRQTVDQIVDRILALPDGTRLQLLAPVIRSRKGEYIKVFDDARKAGYSRVRVDKSIYDLSESIKLDKNKKHTIEVVVDRISVSEEEARRLADSVETTSGLSGGIVVAHLVDSDEELTFSQNYACDECGVSMEELTPRLFSFNAPHGACPNCTGLGVQLKVDPDLIVPNYNKSLNDGAVRASNWANARSDGIARMYFTALGKRFGFTLDTPLSEFSEEAINALLYGTGKEELTLKYDRGRGSGTYQQAFEGVVTNIARRYKDTSSGFMRFELEQYMSEYPCEACGGKRLKPEVLAVTVGGSSISDMTTLSITDALNFAQTVPLTGSDAFIAEGILKEIRERLGFLQNVGLDYLTLSRMAGTLSGGEAQRIRLASQVGSSLTGVLYILDEPSIGLHQRDNRKLLETLKRLRDLGNTLIVVEHDEETMLESDYVVDIGPGAGNQGGEVIFGGTPAELLECRESLTAAYLSGREAIPIPKKRRKGSGYYLTIKGAEENNLQNIDVSIPLGIFTAVTGVSGSGKSSLINGIVYKFLAGKLNHAKTRPGKFAEITGWEQLDKIVDIDQSPIGRTPRSNPATYTSAFNDIRDLFSQTNDARERGYAPGRFSFNVKGGRCEACSGDGLKKIEMHFLADIYVPCEVCKGTRYNRETLEVKYKGKSIADVLAMTVDDALDFFTNMPKIQAKIQALYDVGLGYVKLGQSSTELSGGEAQRVKLATELARKATGRTLYVLDEPTTGLHSHDVRKLLTVLERLTEAGNTVVVIEHNLDVIKSADWVIDLGPEGGDKGGTIVCTGTPEQVARVKNSATGQYVKFALKGYKK